jgi:hypothetical protein
MKILIFLNTSAAGRHRRPARPAALALGRNADNFVFCAQHLSYDGTMWQKTNSGDWSMVRENLPLGQRVEAGTWLISREARCQFDVTRPSPLARICARRPNPGQPGGVDALIAPSPQRGGGGHRPERVLAIPTTTGFDLRQGYATNVSLSH